MVICKICDRYFKNNWALAIHISKMHQIKKEEYYIQYINNSRKCLTCDKLTDFINLKLGFKKYCKECICINSKKKRIKTVLKKYGVEHVLQSKKIKEKKNQSCLDRYGVEYPLKLNKFNEKRKKTNLKKFGVENPMQSEKVKEKKRQTCLIKYGVEHPFQLENIKKKIIKTNLQKYGVENPLQNKEIREKYKQTCLLKYGVETPFQSEDIKIKIRRTEKKIFFNRLLNSDRLKEKCTPNFNIDEYQDVNSIYSWVCTKCQTIFEGSIDNGYIPRCPICYPFNSSSLGEKEIVEFIQSLNIDLIENDRSILFPKELDIYIPSHNLAIEFDGLYWHSELGGRKDKDYHLNKTLQCESKGVQLLHIFEDEWIDKQEIVKSIIKAKLNKLENIIYARKCEIQSVPNDEAKLFLFDNHLQGPINGNHYGLYYEDKLVSIITYGKSRFNKNYEYELLRFCNKINTSVVGGFSKLFKNILRGLSLISYCDLRYGNGNVYKNNGFKLINSSNPSYYYMKEYQRLSRLNFQKHLLQEKLDIFDPNLTEWENMQLNEYDRIWDCGNLVFVAIWNSI